MTLYRNPGTEDIWTSDELTASLRSEIAALDDEDSLKQEVELHGDAAIREYVIECCLVGIYSRVDDGEDVAYRRASDGRVFWAAEIEEAYIEAMSYADSDYKTTFSDWLGRVLDAGEFAAVNADEA